MFKTIAAAIITVAAVGSLSACGTSTPTAAQQINCDNVITAAGDMSLDMSKFTLDVQLASISGGWTAVVKSAKELSVKLTADAAPLAGTAQGDSVVAAVKGFSAADFSTQASLTAALNTLKAPMAALPTICPKA